VGDTSMVGRTTGVKAAGSTPQIAAARRAHSIESNASGCGIRLDRVRAACSRDLGRRPGRLDPRGPSDHRGIPHRATGAGARRGRSRAASRPRSSRGAGARARAGCARRRRRPRGSRNSGLHLPDRQARGSLVTVGGRRDRSTEPGRHRAAGRQAARRSQAGGSRVTPARRSSAPSGCHRAPHPPRRQAHTDPRINPRLHARVVELHRRRAARVADDSGHPARFEAGPEARPREAKAGCAASPVAAAPPAQAAADSRATDAGHPDDPAYGNHSHRRGHAAAGLGRGDPDEEEEAEAAADHHRRAAASVGDRGQWRR